MQNDRPEGAVSVDENEGRSENFTRRTAEERYKIVDGVWLVFPANVNSTAEPIEGPFEIDGELYLTYNVPDKDGIFAPRRLATKPSILKARAEEREEKTAKLPAAILAAIRANMGRGR